MRAESFPNAEASSCAAHDGAMSKSRTTDQSRKTNGAFPTRSSAQAFARSVAWEHGARVTVVRRDDGWCVLDAGTPRNAPRCDESQASEPDLDDGSGSLPPRGGEKLQH